MRTQCTHSRHLSCHSNKLALFGSCVSSAIRGRSVALHSSSSQTSAAQTANGPDADTVHSFSPFELSFKQTGSLWELCEQRHSGAQCRIALQLIADKRSADGERPRCGHSAFILAI